MNNNSLKGCLFFLAILIQSRLDCILAHARFFELLLTSLYLLPKFHKQKERKNCLKYAFLYIGAWVSITSSPPLPPIPYHTIRSQLGSAPPFGLSQCVGEPARKIAQQPLPWPNIYPMVMIDTASMPQQGSSQSRTPGNCHHVRQIEECKNLPPYLTELFSTQCPNVCLYAAY